MIGIALGECCSGHWSQARGCASLVQRADETLVGPIDPGVYGVHAGRVVLAVSFRLLHRASLSDWVHAARERGTVMRRLASARRR